MVRQTEKTNFKALTLATTLVVANILQVTPSGTLRVRAEEYLALEADLTEVFTSDAAAVEEVPVTEVKVEEVKEVVEYVSEEAVERVEDTEATYKKNETESSDGSAYRVEYVEVKEDSTSDKDILVEKVSDYEKIIEIEEHAESEYLGTISQLFPNEELARYIANRINKEINNYVTIEDLEQITYVQVSSLDSLQGLQLLDNLYHVSLLYGETIDWNTLLSLQSLRSLALTSIHVNDLTPLSSFPNLISLQLETFQISDLSFLSSLTNLTDLFLGYLQIADLSPIASLFNLTSLTVNWSQVSDLTPLESLSNLTSLTLVDNQVSNLY